MKYSGEKVSGRPWDVTISIGPSTNCFVCARMDSISTLMNPMILS